MASRPPQILPEAALTSLPGAYYVPDVLTTSLKRSILFDFPLKNYSWSPPKSEESGVGKIEEGKGAVEVLVETEGGAKKRTRDLRGPNLYGITGYGGPRLHVYGKVKQCPDRLYTSLPHSLQALVDTLLDMNLLTKKPFQITVNTYDTAQKKLIPHKDGVGEQVCIVSLGHHTVMDMYHYPKHPAPFTRVFPNPENPDDDWDIDGESEDPEEGLKEEAGNGIYSELSEKRRKRMVGRLWLEDSSVLCLRRESYFDYAHGITAKEFDVFLPVDENDSRNETETVCEQQSHHTVRWLNGEQVEKGLHCPPPGTQSYRGSRISIVVWS